MRPTILNFLTKRTHQDAPNVYEYNHNLGLNVIRINEQCVSAIDYNDSINNDTAKGDTVCHLSTLTEVSREGVDSGLDMMLSTFTKAGREGVDDHLNMMLSTETRANRESSDSCIDLALATKTFTDRESDD